ncbi:MAG: hypothetical protein KAJ18_09840 [Candidatus Omnitrophica bacterium]|nr:hypothetical protein [Candidatus Omnitrophota bacterium]
MGKTKTRVLVVDDENVSTMILQSSILKEFEFQKAITAQHALEMIQDSPLETLLSMKDD